MTSHTVYTDLVALKLYQKITMFLYNSPCLYPLQIIIKLLNSTVVEGTGNYSPCRGCNLSAGLASI